MQILQDFDLRLDYSCLMIRYGVIATEVFGDFLSLFEIVAWHVGEQVVLDLIVEAPKSEVGDRMRPHISRG